LLGTFPVAGFANPSEANERSGCPIQSQRPLLDARLLQGTMESLCSYLPASILSFLIEQQASRGSGSCNGQLTPPAAGSSSTAGGWQMHAPCRQSYPTAVLFADISGYTALCESMASKSSGGGGQGDEFLARHLNSYFEQLVRLIMSQGGDVFKFAGDAVLVLWPPGSDESLTTLTRRAAQCGLDIKSSLQSVSLAPGVTLSVKVGVGVGQVSILHVGGVFGRMEYVACDGGSGPSSSDNASANAADAAAQAATNAANANANNTTTEDGPLRQAFNAEHQCEAPDVVVSPEAYVTAISHSRADMPCGVMVVVRLVTLAHFSLCVSVSASVLTAAPAVGR
jgi:hypothetical protein